MALERCKRAYCRGTLIPERATFTDPEPEPICSMCGRTPEWAPVQTLLFEVVSTDLRKGRTSLIGNKKLRASA